MKSIEIVIPTRNRLEKLQRCLKSIPKKAGDISVSVTVVCDADPLTAHCLNNNGSVSKILLVKNHRGSVYCRNLAIKDVEDALIYATDDILFMDNSIDEAVAVMQEKFPDDDGVVGFNQVNHRNFCISGVGLVGQKFLLRYPEKQLFYPGYFHFSCQEIERLGKKLGKIVLAEKAKLIHYHPGEVRAEIDETHVEARRMREADRVISMERLDKGIIWGDE